MLLTIDIEYRHENRDGCLHLENVLNHMDELFPWNNNTYNINLSNENGFSIREKNPNL